MFPNESADYRAARDTLLTAEAGLRAQTEAVAALRRRLPVGGEVPTDYEFEEGHFETGMPQRKVRLSELFAPGKDTLVVYSYMNGPEMKAPCTSCTSILDSMDGASDHVNQRVNLVVVAKNPIEKVMATARERGWRHLRIISSANNTFNHDYKGETADGHQMPGVNVFVRRNNSIHHFWHSELLWAPSEKGQDARHADTFWPLWNLFDLTPVGRGSDWHPKLAYDAPVPLTLGRR